MEITCPSCGKINQSAPCQRCGCDLGPLFSIRQAALAELAAAATSLRCGEAHEASAHAAQSWELRHSPEAARLAFLACVALEDYATALLWNCRTSAR